MTLCMCGALLTGPAFADDLSDARASLDEAEVRLQTITEQYTSIQEEIDSTQKEIDGLLDDVYAAQSAVVSGQESLGVSCVYNYKVDTLTTLTLFLESESFDELTRNFQYLGHIQSAQAEEIAAQKQRKEDLNKKIDALDKKRDDQEKRIKEAEAKKAEAAKVVSDAESKVSRIEDEHAKAELKRLEKMKAEAEALEKQKEEDKKVQINNSWNTNTEEKPGENAQPEKPDASSPNPDKGPVHQSKPDEPKDEQSGWQTGLASAYGGSTDPYTPNPGYTATGAICDDNSMGVAIPMSWPNYRSYLGRSVEISYGGKTVVAVVNDIGHMGGGSRSLDLQPGVFKQFGASSCNGWGVRTVSYRFL